MESLSLSKLNLYIKRVLSLNFQDPVWITAEIFSLKQKNGHIYLELTEKDETDSIKAQNSAIIWSSTLLSIMSKQQQDLFGILQEGNEVKVAIIVDYNIRYGLKLIVQNVDSDFTLGKLAKIRLQTIHKLKSENLWQKNHHSHLPVVIKKIAVITSVNSAGYLDFENQLSQNNYNYKFELHKYDVSVQGKNAKSEIIEAFTKINSQSKSFDIIVLIRGGGSKTDLIDFDSFYIAREVSLSKLPVITGIGHFIDESIADLSAFRSLKTPTAVADFIINYNFNRELEINIKFENLEANCRLLVGSALDSLVLIKEAISTNISQIILNKYKQLSAINYSISNKSYQLYHSNFKRIAEYKMLIHSNDPEELFKKGYSISYIENELLSKRKVISIGDQIKTYYKNGVLFSKVISNEK